MLAYHGFIFEPDTYEVLTIIDLSTAKRHNIYRIKTDHTIQDVKWLDGDRLFLAVRDERPIENRRLNAIQNVKYLYTVDADGKNLQLLDSGIFSDMFFSRDGSGFIYKDREERYRYYDIAARSSKAITAKLPKSTWPLYLSKDKALFALYVRRKAAYVEMIDLATMSARTVTLPINPEKPGIFVHPEIYSPDLAKYAYITGGGTDWYNSGTIKLYVRDIPESMRKRLAF